MEPDECEPYPSRRKLAVEEGALPSEVVEPISWVSVVVKSAA